MEQFEARKRELLKWANQTENADRVSKTIISAESDPTDYLFPLRLRPGCTSAELSQRRRRPPYRHPHAP